MAECSARHSPLLASLQGGVDAPIHKIARSHLSRAQTGWFSFWIYRKTTPASRTVELRDISLIARPPLLAVMQGGDSALPIHSAIFHSSITAATKGSNDVHN